MRGLCADCVVLKTISNSMRTSSMKVVSTLWAIWGAASLVSALTGPTIHVEQGAVKGTTLLSAGGKPFQAFQGIPYGKAPEPVPAKPWVGVWPAERPGSPCLQYMHTMHQEDEKIVGSEDCLYLNVYTPKLPGIGKPPLLDVIVYIHGGAFMFGWGHQYGPRYYMNRDVVYVTFNYRLGVLGFLSTEDEVVPGNNGLKDQVLALKWVQKNIAAFGGNPDSVTISGTSAGGASVHYHYFSPMSRGLFHRGMSYSGTALCPWTQAEELRSKANLIAASLGCQTSLSREMVACLRKRPAEKIVALTKELMVWLYNPFSPFGPTVEVAGNTPFLINEPLSDTLEIKLKNLPWLTSLTTEEGLYPAAEFVNNEQHLQELNKRFVEIAPSLLDYNYTVPLEQQLQVTEEIRKKYFGDLPIGPDTVKQLVKMIGDRLFNVDGELAAKFQARVSQAPVYFYLFSYRGKHSLSEFMSGSTDNFGVSHADDTAYTSDVYYSNTEETEQDKAMSMLLLDLFTSFAKTGVPQVPGNKDVTWEPVTGNAENITYLYIPDSTNLKMRSNKDLSNKDFWLSLPINEPHKSFKEARARSTDEL
uniref:Carboxylic ester hydrolase n=1 Tax=Timema bartmani TaxID=61472 RepID=A0A7R9EXW7_9NEOP|nr:unnamed protein product [Timema bartmani]